MESSTQEFDNPFTPTFGEVPLFMAGRSLQMHELSRAFASKTRRPALTTAITGARGSGKTAMLYSAGNIARSNGWVVVNVACLPGMLNDIIITARREAFHLLDVPAKTQVSALELGGVVKAEFNRNNVFTNWRNDVYEILDQLETSETGLLICVDEVQPGLDEMVQLAASYQLFVGEGRKIALLMAGLPQNILALNNDKSASFLRRAQKISLGRIPDYEVEEAILKTVAGAGRKIAPEALQVAVDAAEGFAYMVQLVGFRIWDQHPCEYEIALEDAYAGAQLANLELMDGVVRSTYESLSAMDRKFLVAMLDDAESSEVKTVAKRLGKTNSYAAQYKARLLGQGVIEETIDGKVKFQLPQMREFLSKVAGSEL
jgi:hypothetical protein